MITPPLSISAMPRLTRAVPVTVPSAETWVETLAKTLVETLVGEDFEGLGGVRRSVLLDMGQAYGRDWLPTNSATKPGPASGQPPP